MLVFLIHSQEPSQASMLCGTLTWVGGVLVLNLAEVGGAGRPDTVFFSAPWVCLTAIMLFPTTMGSDS